MSKHQDRVFFRNFSLTLVGLALFGVFASFMGKWIARLVPEHSQTELISQRVAPVGQVYTEDAPPPAIVNETAVAAASTAQSGQQVYEGVCAACHSTGLAGAPKLGDKDGWASRLAQGTDTLYERAIKGFQGSAGVMPAKGGRADLSDDAVKAAVDYMLAQSGGPAAPAVDTTAAGSAPESEAATAAPEPAPEAAPATETPTAETPAPEAAAPAATVTADSGANGKGKQIYDSACFVCHAAGVAGAPKLGDKENWAPRIAAGADQLHDHAIKGFMGKAGMMPPKGGRMDLSDDDVKAAVDYMVQSVQ